MQRYKILWVDDEIDLLKPHILYLEQKNYKIKIFSDPFSLIEYIKTHNDFDLVLVDENMPGKTGISLISDIKKEIYDYYQSIIKNIRGLSLSKVPNYAISNHWLSLLRINNEILVSRTNIDFLDLIIENYYI